MVEQVDRDAVDKLNFAKTAEQHRELLEAFAAHRKAGMEAAAKIVEKDAEGMSWSESASISGAGFELIKRAKAIRTALKGNQ